jgi:CRISPR-associated protein Cas1
MGVEGEAAAVYWPALARGIDPAWGFGGRRARRTREDPVNIMFDVVASLLARDIAVAASRVGLHPGFAALHTVGGERPALVFDLMEEFRAPVAEAVVLALAARNAVRPEMFVRDGARWRMTRDAWGPLIRGYEAWLARPIREPRSGERTLWRGLFEIQASAYAAACERGADYIPYAMDY